MHRGVLAADVGCRRYPELLDKLAPAGALARMTDERLQREHASPQLHEESRLLLATAKQRGERRCIADGVVARVVVAQDADRSVDPRRDHRDAGGDRLRDDIGAALGPTCQDQQRRGCEYAQRLAAAARPEPWPARVQGVLGVSLEPWRG